MKYIIFILSVLFAGPALADNLGGSEFHHSPGSGDSEFKYEFVYSTTEAEIVGTGDVSSTVLKDSGSFNISYSYGLDQEHYYEVKLGYEKVDQTNKPEGSADIESENTGLQDVSIIGGGTYLYTNGFFTWDAILTIPTGDVEDNSTTNEGNVTTGIYNLAGEVGYTWEFKDKTMVGLAVEYTLYNTEGTKVDDGNNSDIDFEVEPNSYVTVFYEELRKGSLWGVSFQYGNEGETEFGDGSGGVNPGEMYFALATYWRIEMGGGVLLPQISYAEILPRGDHTTVDNFEFEGGNNIRAHLGYRHSF